MTLVVRYRRMSDVGQRQQIRWAMFGFGGTAIAGATSVIADALVGPNLPPAVRLDLSVLSTVAMVLAFILGSLGLVVALLRYRLYDADAAISRSVAYGALTIALLGVFAGTEKLVEAFGEAYLGDSLGGLAGGIGAGLAAILLVPLHHRINHWAEHRFQRPLVRLRRDLPILVSDLRDTAGVDQIAAATLDQVAEGVHATRAALVVGNAIKAARGINAADVEAWRASWTPAVQDGVDIDRDDTLFPMRMPLLAGGDGRVGWLLLGPRPDGSFYGKDERAALADIADPVARALRAAGMRDAQALDDKAWRDRQDGLIAALAGEVAALRARIARP